MPGEHGGRVLGGMPVAILVSLPRHVRWAATGWSASCWSPAGSDRATIAGTGLIFPAVDHLFRPGELPKVLPDSSSGTLFSTL